MALFKLHWVYVKEPTKKKNPAAVALAKLSVASITPEERREHGSKGGAIGGHARAKALTKKRRSEIAQAAAKARWAKPEESKKESA